VLEHHIGTIEYVDRLVAFVDMLGWKDLVAKSAENPNLLASIVMLSTAQNGMGDISEDGNGIRHIRMSDASIFVADPNNKTEVFTLTNSIIMLHQTALLHGWLARGSVVRGKIYYSENSPVILGPALTTAHENSENGIAFYPRTVLDQSTVELISEMYTDKSVHDEFKKQFPLTNGIPIEKDNDDLSFFSYLGGFMQSCFTEHYRSQILAGLRENKNNPKVHQKYLWLKNYFNSVYKNAAIGDH